MLISPSFIRHQWTHGGRDTGRGFTHSAAHEATCFSVCTLIPCQEASCSNSFLVLTGCQTSLSSFLLVSTVLYTAEKSARLLRFPSLSSPAKTTGEDSYTLFSSQHSIRGGCFAWEAPEGNRKASTGLWSDFGTSAEKILFKHKLVSVIQSHQIV